MKPIQITVRKNLIIPAESSVLFHSLLVDFYDIQYSLEENDEKKLGLGQPCPNILLNFSHQTFVVWFFFPNNSKQRPNKYSVFQLRMKLFTKKLQHFLALKNCFINIKLTWSNGHEIILGLTRTEHTEKVLASSRITSSEVCDWSFEFHQGIFHNKKNETLWNTIQMNKTLIYDAKFGIYYKL